MKGQHVNVVAVKLDRRKKILCVIMAIALIGLMIPHGILAQVRAFAEQNTQTDITATEEVTNPEATVTDEATPQATEDIANDASQDATTGEVTAEASAPEVKYHESRNGIEVVPPAQRIFANGPSNDALSATFSIEGVGIETSLEMYSYDVYDWYGEKDIDIVSDEPITDPTFPYAFFDEYSYYYVDADTNILLLIYDTYQGEYRVVQVMPYEYGTAKFKGWSLNGEALIPDKEHQFDPDVSLYAFTANYEKDTSGYAAKLKLFSDEEGEDITIRQSALPVGWSFSPDGLWASKVFAEGTTYEAIYKDFLGEDNGWALHLAGHKFTGWTTEAGGTTLVKDTEFNYNFDEMADITVKAYAGDGEFTDYQYYEEWKPVDGHYEAEYAYDSITMREVVNKWTFDYPHKNGGIFDKWNYTPAANTYLIEDAVMTATYKDKATYKVDFNVDVISNGLLNNPTCDGGYIDGAGSYYVPENSEYFHNGTLESYILEDMETELYRSVIAIPNEGYEFAGWVITPEGSEDEGTVVCDMTFTAKFKSLDSAVATFDFTDDTDVFVDGTKAAAAEWTKDADSNKWTKAFPGGSVLVQDLEDEWTGYVTYQDGSKYVWRNDCLYASYYSPLIINITWTPHKIGAEDYKLTVRTASNYGFNASLDDVDFDSGLSYYQFVNQEFEPSTEYIDTYFSKYPLNTKSSYGLIGYQIIDNCLYYGYVNNKETVVWYYGIVQPDLTNAVNPYVQWSVNGEPITTSNFVYFKPNQKTYNFTYEVKESVNVRGQVTDALTDDPIAYEYVDFIPGEDPGAPELLYTETSDMGLYYMNIPKGTSGFLKVEVYGYATEIVNVDGSEEQVIDIKLYPKLEISGRVIGVDGTQFEGAKVTLHDADTTDQIGPELSTNEYGYYRWWNENSVVLKDSKYYAADGSLTNLYVEVSYKPFTSKDSFTGKYVGNFVKGGDAAYNAEDIILEPTLASPDWGVSALVETSSLHNKFYVSGTYRSGGDTHIYVEDPFDEFSADQLFHGTKVGITEDYGLHLEYEYDNSPSDTSYNLVIIAQSKDDIYTPYAWSFNGSWLQDYADPDFVVDFRTLSATDPQAKFAIEYKETVAATIEAEGVEGHGTFHTDYYIDDTEHLKPVKSWDSPSINDNIYVGTKITLMKNGQLHLEFKDKNLTNLNADEDTYDECGVVTPIPAEGYQLVRWTLNGAVFNVDDTYTVKNGDTIDLSPAYELINQPEHIDASAQTGDTSASTLAILAIIALSGLAVVSSRRKFN